jgi:hypothetical protein
MPPDCGTWEETMEKPLATGVVKVPWGTSPTKVIVKALGD